MGATADFHAAVTVVVVALAFVALLRDYVAADWTMMLAVATLNLCGAVSYTHLTLPTKA